MDASSYATMDENYDTSNANSDVGIEISIPVFEHRVKYISHFCVIIVLL